MTDIADKYISKSGRLPNYGQKEFAQDLGTAANFLAWAEEDRAFYAGIEAREAFNAMCRMLDIDPIGLRKVLDV